MNLFLSQIFIKYSLFDLIFNGHVWFQHQIDNYHDQYSHRMAHGVNDLDQHQSEF